jgi:tetratricopeptide (TPR) repeat protein
MKLSPLVRICAAVLVAFAVHACQAGSDQAATNEAAPIQVAQKAFPAGTDSEVAAAKIREVQRRQENLQGGAANQELITEAIEADPEFALAYLYRAYQFPPDMEALAKAEELAEKAPDSHRRYIELQASTFKDPTAAPNIAAIEPLTKLAEEYPGERNLWVVIGQYQQMDGRTADARKSYERALALDSSTPRVHAMLAGTHILDGRYAEARESLEGALQKVPADATPVNIRYQVAFTHLYEGDVDAALAVLTQLAADYEEAGRPFGIPEVFIWNSIARINLEDGRLEAAMKAYERGYESVPDSDLDETQKKIWYGRLLHGKSRTLARMGDHEEAWKNVVTVRQMIDEGGEEGEPFEAAYHYLAGYCKLEAGETESAIEHLEQADPNDPFQRLLLARAYEKAGHEAKARQAYEEVAASQTNNIERALSLPEAQQKLGAS